MSSPLAGIPVPKRRQLAATLGLFSTLFLAVGAVAATAANTALMKVFVTIALVVTVSLALLAWGVARSTKLDADSRRLDDAIEEALRAGGGQSCDCGNEHDPDELHFVDGEGQHVTGRSSAQACAHDGTGTECTHSCDTCVLAALRPLEPAAAFERPTAAARRRPQPGPGRLPRG